jgi:hypothetical protein
MSGNRETLDLSISRLTGLLALRSARELPGGWSGRFGISSDMRPPFRGADGALLHTSQLLRLRSPRRPAE